MVSIFSDQECIESKAKLSLGSSKPYSFREVFCITQSIWSTFLQEHVLANCGSRNKNTAFFMSSAADISSYAERAYTLIRSFILCRKILYTYKDILSYAERSYTLINL